MRIIAVVSTTFMILGAGSMGAAALDLKGSETMKSLVNTLVLSPAFDCGGALNTPAGSLIYVGGGAAAGEAAILSGAQQVAPMSRFLKPFTPRTDQVCGLPVIPGGPLPPGGTLSLPDGGTLGAGQSQSTSEAIVFALDALVIAGNIANAGAASCNGDPATPCSPPIAKGIANGNTMTVAGYVCPTATDTAPYMPADPSCVNGQYKILDSQDALRLLYFGLDHDFKGAAQRNCGNPNAGSSYLGNPGLVRATLVENWNNLFRDPTSCAGCTRLWRVFRLNDQSGVTDALIRLTGRTAVCASASSPCLSPGQTVTVAVPPIDPTARSSPFCNSRQLSGVQCGPGDQGGFDNFNNPNNLPFRLFADTALNTRGPTVDYDPPAPPTAPGGSDVNPRINLWDFPDLNFDPIGTLPYFTDFQDFDCIRRQCSGLFAQPGQPQEQVCSARGDLGLVVPIPDQPAQSGTVTPFANPDCASGVINFIGVAAPPCARVVPLANRPSLCPNGQLPIASACLAGIMNPGVCAAPSTGSFPPAGVLPLDPRCRNSALNILPAQHRVDGRVYNLHVHEYKPVGNPPYPYATILHQDPNAPNTMIPVPMVSAFYRIHQDNFLALARPNHMVIADSGGAHSFQTTPGLGTGACNPTTVAPNLASAMRLISCFVGSADPCSLGFGPFPMVSSFGVEGMRINGIAPDTSCIQNGTYPFSSKLFLNTVKGFENVTGDELKLTKCFAARSPGIVPGFPGMDPIAVMNGYVPLTAAPGDAQCLDFAEDALCGTVPATNACSNNDAGIPQ